MRRVIGRGVDLEASDARYERRVVMMVVVEVVVVRVVPWWLPRAPCPSSDTR